MREHLRMLCRIMVERFTPMLSALRQVECEEGDDLSKFLQDLPADGTEFALVSMRERYLAGGEPILDAEQWDWLSDAACILSIMFGIDWISKAVLSRLTVSEGKGEAEAIVFESAQLLLLDALYQLEYVSDEFVELSERGSAEYRKSVRAIQTLLAKLNEMPTAIGKRKLARQVSTATLYFRRRQHDVVFTSKINDFTPLCLAMSQWFDGFDPDDEDEEEDEPPLMEFDVLAGTPWREHAGDDETDEDIEILNPVQALLDDVEKYSRVLCELRSSELTQVG